MSTDPLRRSRLTAAAIAASPGGSQAASEPKWTARAPPGRNASSSADQRKSAPSTNWYVAWPSASRTSAIVLGSVAVTTCRRSTAARSRCRRSMVPNGSSDSRPANAVRSPSRARPTATFIGLPPGLATDDPSSAGAARSMSASPITTKAGGSSSCTARRYRTPRLRAVAGAHCVLPQLLDANEVARRIPEGAVADSVRLLGRFLHYLGATGLQALEGAVEILGGQQDPAVGALGHHLRDGAAFVVG